MNLFRNEGGQKCPGIFFDNLGLIKKEYPMKKLNSKNEKGEDLSANLDLRSHKSHYPKRELKRKASFNSQLPARFHFPAAMCSNYLINQILKVCSLLLNMKIKSVVTILLTCLLTSMIVNAQVKSLVVNDVKRRYIVYVPKSYEIKKDKNFPVVFNFHGGGMTMAEQMLYTQMNKTADKYNFIVVYPQGIKQDWNVGFEMSYTEGTDDIGFIDSLLTSLAKDYRIDSKKVYATGLSRGGFFCQRIASELSGKFTAIASVGATMPEPVVKHNNRTKTKIGVMIVHGTSDEVVKYEGKKEAYLSALETYKYWKSQNDLSNSKDISKTIDGNKSDGTRVLISESMNDSNYVSLVTIKEGGHTWAGADSFNIGLPIGKTSQDINLNELIWEFFTKNRKE